MNRFERLRKEAELTQVEVAKHLGVDQTAVSRWERGKGLPATSKLPILAKIFNCTINDLFEASEPETVVEER